MAAITRLQPARTLASDADRTWFWTRIDATLPADVGDQCARLATQLEPLTDQELVDFIHLFHGVKNQLYSWRLWAAAYLMNGGCSDDGFMDFRSWLISRGQAITEAAMRDPDTLAALGVEMDEATFEPFGYVMSDAFRARAGGSFPAIAGEAASDEPADPDWGFDFEDGAEMERRLPKLAAEYLA
ncbi:hypothetical protein GCM10007301_11850 [Azorhizobium oxalatiphilum]|uniref:DUF4240 domain-containing protein n=1 Tax=Azorhizobium oxalatiphilum TaxID=980631 RepID=A0A917BR98_9HYPH|nr:DUF4240 domain-containing protein [Azorhizobium oxalatiphilum]GGF53999.1 hypothetical protein GCM10007301_11850 [Azorhizobium oxalatiphilum]